MRWTTQEALPSSDGIRAAFEDVLAGEEFRYAEAAPWARWFQAFVDFLRDVLGRWWPDLEDSDLRMISWAALALFTIAVVLLAHRWASRLERRSRRVARDAEGGAEAPLDARGWASRARAAAAAGRYREAATGLYQATILDMDARGRLRYRDWKTPGDYAVEVSGEEATRAGFIAFLGDFLTIAFGPADPDASAFEALTTRAAALGSPT